MEWKREWIDVRVRLPRNGQVVFSFGELGVSIARFQPGQHGCAWQNCSYPRTRRICPEVVSSIGWVTHWMPIPTLPRISKDERRSIEEEK